MIAIILLVLFTLLSVADVWTTLKLLARGGRELNPLLLMSMRRLGEVPGLVVVKAVITGVLITITLTQTAYITAVSWGLGIANIAMVLVVFNNVRVLKTLK
jgi:hypothetical protein